MIFADISDGMAVFLDSNTLIFHFSQHATHGQPCTQLVHRVQLGQVQGWTTPSVLYETSHRLMTIEAMAKFNWPPAGIAARLRSHSTEMGKLILSEQAMQALAASRLTLATMTFNTGALASQISRQYGLLTGDALLVAAMQEHQVPHLASLDPDFDRVPGITRYSPT